MRKTKKDQQGSPEPYEDVIRLEQLDPYEALITKKYLLKNNNKSMQ